MFIDTRPKLVAREQIIETDSRVTRLPLVYLDLCTFKVLSKFFELANPTEELSSNRNISVAPFLLAL